MIFFLLLFFFNDRAFYLFEGMAWGGSLDEETPVIMTDMDPLKQLSGDRPWVPPQYEGQDGALGYKSGETFSVPLGMQERVSFWIDIYTKYSTDQGLLHDSQYVHLVYEPVDFTDIMAQPDLNLHQKTRARKKRVDEAKKKIRERLLRLQKTTSPESLTGEDLRYWHLFSRVDGEKKFADAAGEGRLRFQLGQRDRFEQGIHYSGRYLSEMEKIFQEEHLPIELTRLPFVESSFNIKARSRVGASGIWQFMRYTGRQYLKMNAWVDERNEPLMATRAAARLLKFNYNFLDSWPLAITAYNHGPAGVKRLVQKFGTSDIVELLDVRKGRFGFASANFYASFLAALTVEKNARAFFTHPIWMPSVKTEIYKLDRSLMINNLVQLFQNNEQKAREANPHLYTHVWKGKQKLRKGIRVQIPTGTKNQLMVNADSKEKQNLTRNSNQPNSTSSEGSDEKEAQQEYLIERGDTLSGIAQQFGVSVQNLIEFNNIIRPRFLRPGTKIFIPNSNP